MRPRRSTRHSQVLLGILTVVAVLVPVQFPVASATSSGTALGSGFAVERVFSATQDDWEPTVASDPSSHWVYQATTYINASKTCGTCPGTSIEFRSSSDSGRTWGAPSFICADVCSDLRDGWQYDPQLKVSTNGTIYAVFLLDFNPGASLFKSYDHGTTWSGPVYLNGNLSYDDKPILVISPSGKDVYVAYNDKLTGYVVASHDYGTHFGPPVRAVTGLWEYAYGGAISPSGTVYFAEVGESGGKVTNQGHVVGPDTIEILSSSSGGRSWKTVFTAPSGSPTPCTVSQCYGDFLAAQASVAVDSGGEVLAAFTNNTQNATAKSLYVTMSTDGVHWSSAVAVNRRGDSNMVNVAAGSKAGDFRLAWQDDRNAACWDCGGTGGWNTWYAETTDGGRSWSSAVRLSDLGSGAPYKSSLGYTALLGDYFGLAVNATGAAFLIWGEGDGSSIYCCGGSWFTRGT